MSKDNPDDASLSFKPLYDEPINPDEIRLDDEEDYIHVPPSVPSPLAVTKFLDENASHMGRVFVSGWRVDGVGAHR